jgi:hypothetical protein
MKDSPALARISSGNAEERSIRKTVKEYQRVLRGRAGKFLNNIRLLCEIMTVKEGLPCSEGKFSIVIPGSHYI